MDVGIFAKHVTDFLWRVRPLEGEFRRRPRGIWTSELFAFCALAKHLRVGRVLEAGVYHGQSTVVLRWFFTPEGVGVCSVDKKIPPGVTEFFQTPLRMHQLLEGSAEIALCADLDAHPLARVALLVDGPKGLSGVRLIKDFLARYPQIVMAALHDTFETEPPGGNAARDALIKYAAGPRSPWWATDDPPFVEAYKYLDGSARGYSQWLAENGTGKLPYTLRKLPVKDERPVEVPMTSYGPTLTFVFREAL